MKQRMLAILLTLLLTFSLLPAAVFADETSGEAAAGETAEAQEDEPEASAETEEDLAEEVSDDPVSEEAVTESLETEGTEALVLGSAALTAGEGAIPATGGELSSGTYTLTANVTLTTNNLTISSGEDVTIDLAGYTLTGNGSGSVITVNGALTLTDSSATTANPSGSGKITGGSASYGGGVFVENSGTFTMNGGTISGNTASVGGGVYVTRCTFTMNGGSITNNTVTDSSGGGGVVISYSTFIMDGGTISNNTVSGSYGCGGGVNIYGGSFTMRGGEISGNSAVNGGGVYVSSGSVTGTFAMSGGVISDNSATNGDGVYINTSTYTMSGGVVSGSIYKNGGTISVSGGHFSAAVEDSWLASGYKQYTEATDSDWYTSGVSYTVKKGSVADCIVTVEDAVYDGTEQTPTVTVKDGDGNALTPETDYTVTYESGITAAGTSGDVTITGTGDYYGTVTKTFTVQPATVTPSVSGTTTKIYDGTAAVTADQSLTITLTGVVKGEDVTASAASYVYDSADAGETKTITASNITLIGTAAGNYILSTDTISVTAAIDPKALTEDDFEVNTETETYTGAEIIKAVASTSGLVADTDYTVTYAENVNAGTASITITGKGNYDGTLNYTFAIAQATPTLALSDVTATKTYDGEAVSDPKVTVTLVNGEEYTGTPTITYYDESGAALTSAPADVGSYKVVVTISDAGANYTTVSEEDDFTIIEADMTAEITGFTVPYDGEAHEVTVTAEDGATVTVTYTDAAGEAVTAPTEAGAYTAHVTVTKTGYTTIEQDVTVTITVSSQAISYETAEVTKTVTDGTFTNPLTQTTVFGKITYTSSNTDVATVDEAGQVTIVGVGTATITASVSGADSYTAAAASYTLTVNEVTAPTETGEQILVDSLTEVPEGLQSLYSTVEELQADLFARVSITSSAYTEDNVAYYDVKLQLWNGTTGQWEDATEEDFPAEGITVTLPYPDGTDSSYDFVVVHMFTETSSRLGITAGETETPAVTKTDDGLTVTLKGLSPVAVAWKAADTAATVTVTVTPAATTTAPSTGDAGTPLLWLALLTLCAGGLGAAALIPAGRKKARK